MKSPNKNSDQFDFWNLEKLSEKSNSGFVLTEENKKKISKLVNHVLAGSSLERDNFDYKSQNIPLKRKGTSWLGKINPNPKIMCFVTVELYSDPHIVFFCFQPSLKNKDVPDILGTETFFVNLYLEIIPFSDLEQPYDEPVHYETTFPITVENGKFIQSFLSQNVQNNFRFTRESCFYQLR